MVLSPLEGWRKELFEGIQKHSESQEKSLEARAASDEEILKALKEIKMPLWSALHAMGKSKKRES